MPKKKYIHEKLMGRIIIYLIHSLRKQSTFGDATTGFPAKWRLRNEPNSILMTRHYPDLDSASDWSCRVGNLIQPIRATTQIWAVTRHQYGISALVSQMSFRGETSGDVAKCGLFSQAVTYIKIEISKKKGQFYLLVQLGQNKNTSKNSLIIHKEKTKEINVQWQGCQKALK